MAAKAAESVEDSKNPWLRTYFTNRLAALDKERLSYFETWKEIASTSASRSLPGLDR
jgi:hypothetical protein